MPYGETAPSLPAKGASWSKKLNDVEFNQWLKGTLQKGTPGSVCRWFFIIQGGVLGATSG